MSVIRKAYKPLTSKVIDGIETSAISPVERAGILDAIHLIDDIRCSDDHPTEKGDMILSDAWGYLFGIYEFADAFAKGEPLIDCIIEDDDEKTP